MKTSKINYKKKANNWIAEQLNSIEHDELDIIHCQERVALIKREIKLAKESIILSKKGIERYKAEIRKGEYGDEYKNMIFTDEG